MVHTWWVDQGMPSNPTVMCVLSLFQLMMDKAALRVTHFQELLKMQLHPMVSTAQTCAEICCRDIIMWELGIVFLHLWARTTSVK